MSETNLEDTFPESQFRIPGFAPHFRKDQNQFSGGVIVFIREDIPAKLLFNEEVPVEAIFVELNLRKSNDFHAAHITLTKIICPMTWMC